MSVVEAVAAAEREAREAHDAGTCHLSEWSCSYCETGPHPTDQEQP